MQDSPSFSIIFPEDVFAMKLKIDLSQQCVGCRQCEATCSVVHSGAFSPWLSRVHIARNESTLECTPIICRHCKKALCAAACPVGAIQMSDAGALVVDPAVCIGCKACVEACPFHAMHFNEDDDCAFKCDLCGGKPQCALVCPAHVLVCEE